MNIKDKIKQLLKEVERPLMDIELAEIFDIKKKEYGEFFAILDEMERNGEIMVTRKKKYAVPEFYGLKKGRLQGTQKDLHFHPRRWQWGCIYSSWGFKRGHAR